MDHVSSRRPTGIVLGLIALGITARLVPHPWNATPVMAIALFAGAYLPRRWAILLPWLILAATDIVLGWHATIPFTWGSFMLTGMLGWWIRQRPGVARVAAGTLGGSLLFFVIPNFGVWLPGGLYPMTAAGLRQCYVAAIPFFRTTLLGDAVYAAALFGGYALANGFRLAPAVRAH